MPYKRKLSFIAEELVVEAYTKQGQTLRQIATFHEVSPGTIRNILRRREVVLRERGRRKGTRKRRQSESIEYLRT